VLSSGRGQSHNRRRPALVPLFCVVDPSTAESPSNGAIDNSVLDNMSALIRAESRYFTARILYRVSCRVPEYSTDTGSSYYSPSNVTLGDAMTTSSMTLFKKMSNMSSSKIKLELRFSSLVPRKHSLIGDIDGVRTVYCHCLKYRVVQNVFA